MKTLKVVLTTALTAVLLLLTNSASADCMGPNPEPGVRPPWAGTVCSGEELITLDPADAGTDEGIEEGPYGFAGGDPQRPQPAPYAPFQPHRGK